MTRHVVTSWEEHGVLLDGGTVASAASRTVADEYPYGRPVVRKVRSISIPNCGEAVVEIGDWVLRSASQGVA